MEHDRVRLCVLFVGVENVYRSVIAHAMTDQELRRRRVSSVKVDSAGSSWRRVGEAPPPSVVDAARRRSWALSHRARRFRPDDFGTFDLLIAMDTAVARDLEGVRGGMELRSTFHLVSEPNQIQLLRRWDPYGMPSDEDLIATDPTDPADVERTFSIVERTVPLLVDHLEELIAANPE
jgi:protein-tyrosine-phosphatase